MTSVSFGIQLQLGQWIIISCATILLFKPQHEQGLFGAWIACLLSCHIRTLARYSPGVHSGKRERRADKSCPRFPVKRVFAWFVCSPFTCRLVSQ
jgi:hypothetical protein